jgi:TolB-like protein/class 3 adenylate cyclase/tetratricopeptide (TPR) repeat protein
MYCFSRSLPGSPEPSTFHLWPTQETPLTREQRRLAAILALDVVGYSRLMGRDESGTLARLRGHRSQRLEPTLARHGGRLVKLTGDGALAEFPSAVDAVGAAIEFQQAMADANREQPEEMQIVFRAGLHLGDLIVEGDDLYGDGVNVAARLEAQAPAGGIVISGNVHDAVAGRLKATFDDLGTLALKNIERPVQAFAVIWQPQDWPAAPAGPVADAALALPEKPSIAVLPFQNLSGDPEQEYFADGMVEDIITALSRFKSLFVIARNSSFTYKGKAVDIKQVGRDLGVRYVLEGSVRKAGSRVRITGQLIEAGTGRHLWADKFDGALEDVFGLQDQVTSSVVGLIAPEVEKAEIERANHKPTDRLDSYDFFLRGMALMNRMQFLEARPFFTKAFERDPEYGAAYAMAAWTFMFEQRTSGMPLAAEARAEALRLAHRASKLGTDDAFALARSSHVLTYLGHEYDRGMSMVERAVTLNPNLAAAWYSRGWVALMCGEAEQSIQSFDRMMRLSPLDQLMVLAWNGRSFALFNLGRYETGCASAMKSIQFVQDAHTLSAFIVNAIRAGRTAEARETAALLLRTQPDFSATHAQEAFPVRSADTRGRIIAALREAGLPA